jgi:hypothetical protein
VATGLAQSRIAQLRHGALLYSGRGEYLSGVASFAAAAVEAGDPVLAACASPGLDLLRQRLNGHGSLATWADMRDIGVNPARLIDRIRLFTAQHRGRVIWCVHEPVWSDRSPEELREVIRHEALVNLALADVPVNVLCPYDKRLGTGLIDSVCRRRLKNDPVSSPPGVKIRASLTVRGLPTRKSARAAGPRPAPRTHREQFPMSATGGWTLLPRLPKRSPTATTWLASASSQPAECAGGGFPRTGWATWSSRSANWPLTRWSTPTAREPWPCGPPAAKSSARSTTTATSPIRWPDG